MGEARQYVTEGSALYATFGLALAIIFLVLAIQFESLRDPLVIMVSVPLAICGALIALAWGTATMNIYSQVGLITLVGLITKHGILICEVAKEEQLHNKLSRIEAVMHAAKVRLRPILMTTAAMIAGLIPLMYATGAGCTALQYRYCYRLWSGNWYLVYSVCTVGDLQLPCRETQTTTYVC